MTRLWIALAAMMTLAMPAWAQDGPHSDGIRPDPVLTPGAIRTTDKDEICATRTGTVRNVSEALKMQVYHRYGMKDQHDHFPGTDRGPPFEIDHDLPLCAGGANDITNLWPESSQGEWNFHVKDKLEAHVCRAICAGTISVQDAQAMFLTDWVAGYKKEFGPLPEEGIE